MRRVPLRWLCWTLVSALWPVLGLASCYQPLTCLQDSDCAPGFHCKPQGGECLQLCSQTRLCTTGQRCDLNTGRCVTASPTCTPRANRKCIEGHMVWIDSCSIPQERSDDCGAFGCTDAGCQPDPCGNGTCDTDKGETCASCTADCACQTNEICSPTGTCTPQTAGKCGDGTCASDGTETCTSCPGDCGCDPQQGQVCAEDRCQPTCPESSACHDGKGPGQCVKGQCLSDDNRCQTNTDCKDGKICRNGHCGACQTDADCGASNKCQNGICAIAVAKDQDAWKWSDGTAASNCLVYKQPPSGFVPATKDGQYWLSTGTVTYRTYCIMASHGGGWTMALKLDGREKTFVYNAKLWTDDNTLNPNETQLDLKEAKLLSFSKVSFTELLLGMRDLRTSQLNYVKVGQKGDSLQQLFTEAKDDNVDAPTSDATWRALLIDSSLQTNCKRQVVNFNVNLAYRSSKYSSVVGQLRLGILGNNENNCGTVDSFIGFGSRFYYTNNIVTTGNYVGIANGSDRGTRNTPAFGYIFVR